MTAWRSFWEGPSPFPTATWDWQSELFLRQSRQVFPLGPEDSLLDLGCGPGALAHALARSTPHLAGYVGLDVSAAAVATARDRLARVPAADRFRFAVLGPDYLDLASALSSNFTLRFTRLLALSVVQYYRDASELRRLLDAMHALAAPGAILLIADLPLHQGEGEIWRTLKSAASQGGLSRQVAFLARCALSPYRKVRQNAGLLTFDRQELASIAADCARRYRAKAEVLEDDLTISTGRAHLRISLPGLATQSPA
jgi:SAM-dependent methyltransferase